MSDEGKVGVLLVAAVLIMCCIFSRVEIRKAEIYAGALGNIDVKAAVKLIESIEE